MRPSALRFAFAPALAAAAWVKPSLSPLTTHAVRRISRSVMEAPSVGTLYDMPVSNNGARCRMILYYKGVGAAEVAIESPQTLGGLKSEEYLKLHPQGQMPLLALADGGAIPESDTIARYLIARFADRQPALQPTEPLAAARADVLCRHHDTQMAPIQGCMYKQSLPGAHFFGRFLSRTEALDEMVKQIGVLEGYAHADGPYLLGEAPTAADCAVFPTAVFWMHMLPKFGRDASAAMGPRLGKWWAHMVEKDAVGKRVYGEIMGGLGAWNSKGRWDAIRGAGLRDDGAPSIFDKILAGQIPADVVYEDELVLAFRDISPAAPSHVLLIPKVRQGLTQLQHATAEHKSILGHMLAVGVPAVVQAEKLDSYRLVINDGADACQSVSARVRMHLSRACIPLL